MGKVIVGVTMSLDGFINDRDGSVARLYPDLAELQNLPSLQESIRDTGAVVMGRRAFEMGDPDAYADHYEYQVPIFVLTKNAPKKQPRQNEKSIIGGASVAQQCLNAGLVDELDIDIMPVLFGDGLRLFENLQYERIAPEKVNVMESRVRAHLRFGVLSR